MQTTKDEVNEVSIDSQGCIKIPTEIRTHLRLLPGMTLVVEERGKGELCLCVQKESPEIVEKGGVLVVKGRKAGGDLSDIVSHDRDRRLSKLMAQVGI